MSFEISPDALGFFPLSETEGTFIFRKKILFVRDLEIVSECVPDFKIEKIIPRVQSSVRAFFHKIYIVDEHGNVSKIYYSNRELHICREKKLKIDQNVFFYAKDRFCYLVSSNKVRIFGKTGFVDEIKFDDLEIDTSIKEMPLLKEKNSDVIMTLKDGDISDMYYHELEIYRSFILYKYVTNNIKISRKSQSVYEKKGEFTYLIDQIKGNLNRLCYLSGSWFFF